MTLVFAVMHLYSIFYCSCPFLFYTLKKSGIDKSTEWSTIPACPSLVCFFNRGDTTGTNSSKMLCLMFVFVLFYVNFVGTYFVLFADLCVCVCVCTVNKRQI